MAYSFGNDRQPLAFTDPQLCLVVCSHCLVICRHGVVSFCQRIPLNNCQDFGWKSQDRSCPAVLSSNQNYKAERRDSCLGAGGAGATTFGSLAKSSTPPVTRRIFFGRQNSCVGANQRWRELAGGE
jgi:hypothetical protein